MPRTNPTRRTAITDAGLHLLAHEGVHGLTHRAVERAAGLPAGTAANYFRSREALLVAVAERVVALHLQDMARIDRDTDLATSRDPLVELVAASLLHAATDARERYLAIFELQLEARRRPVLAAALAGLGSAAAGFTADEHAAVGLSVPAGAVPLLTTLYGGVLFTLVTAPGDVPEVAVRQVAHALVHGALEAHAGEP